MANEHALRLTVKRRARWTVTCYMLRIDWIGLPGYCAVANCFRCRWRC